MNVGKGQRVMRAVGRNLAQLVGFRTQKFTSCRHIEEKLLDGDLGSPWKCLFVTGKKRAAGNFDGCAGRAFSLSFQPEPRN